MLFGIGLVGLIVSFVVGVVTAPKGFGVAVVLMLASVALMGVGAEAMQKEQAAACVAKGGEAAVAGRGSMLCLKPGSLIK